MLELLLDNDQRFLTALDDGNLVEIVYEYENEVATMIVKHQGTSRSCSISDIRKNEFDVNKLDPFSPYDTTRELQNMEWEQHNYQKLKAERKNFYMV